MRSTGGSYNVVPDQIGEDNGAGIAERQLRKPDQGSHKTARHSERQNRNQNSWLNTATIDQGGNAIRSQLQISTAPTIPLKASSSYQSGSYNTSDQMAPHRASIRAAIAISQTSIRMGSPTPRLSASPAMAIWQASIRLAEATLRASPREGTAT
jgi:hypothetical protein